MEYSHRFVNAINQAELNLQEKWDLVKKIKSQMSFEDSCVTVYYSIADMENNVRKVLNKMQVLPTNVKVDNITRENLKMAAEMFIYLNTCPDPAWFKFYRDLFEKHSLEFIILTLNRLLKNANKDSHSQFIASTILHRLTSMFSLSYPEIQSRNYGYKIEGSAFHQQNISGT